MFLNFVVVDDDVDDDDDEIVANSDGSEKSQHEGSSLVRK